MGVFIGHEILFCPVEYDAQNGFIRIRIRDLRTPPLRQCAWVVMNTPYQLQRHPRTSSFRRTIRDEWGEDEEWRVAIEYLQMTIEDNLNEFIVMREGDDDAPNDPVDDIPLTPDEELEIQNALASPNIMGWVHSKLDQTIAGEDENKQIVFLLLLSGKVDDPSMKQMILIQGTSGSGKSTLMGIADLFKVKDIGRFTAHALDYAGEELAEFEVLRLKELGFMDKEEDDISTIKFLSGDDQGYTTSVVVRDDQTGRMTTEERHIDPITIISSTVRADVDAQYQRRNWIISPDESIEQTSRIREWTAFNEREKSMVKIGVLGETTKNEARRLLKALVQRLPIADVVIPFPDTLTRILEANSFQNNLRVRGDFGRILSLVQLYGVLNQSNLPSLTRGEVPVVIMTPEKAFEVIQLALLPLTTMTSSIGKKSERMLEALWNEGVRTAGAVIDNDLRNTISTVLERDPKTIRSYLNHLEGAGYLSGDGGRPKTYTMLYSIDDIRRRLSAVSEIIENPRSMLRDMWLETMDYFRTIADADQMREAEEAREDTDEEDEEEVSIEERRNRYLARRIDVPQETAEIITRVLPMFEQMAEQYTLYDDPVTEEVTESEELEPEPDPIQPPEPEPEKETDSEDNRPLRVRSPNLQDQIDRITRFVLNQRFYSEPSVTEQEIADAVELPLEEVKRILQSISVREGCPIWQSRPGRWKENG